MGDIKLALLYISVIFFIGQNAESSNIAITCDPAVSSTFRSNKPSYGQIYEISGSTSNINYDDAATTSCKIQGKDANVETEWIIVGEPPKYLSMESKSDIITQLQGATLICDTLDIDKKNWLPSDEFENSIFSNTTGDVKYNCSEFQVILKGLRMLNRDLSSMLMTTGINTEVCVKYGNKTGQANLIGDVCRIGEYRHMFNEKGEYTCSQCCEDHYWSKRDEQCEKCAECSGREQNNVWTSCIPYDDCTKSTTQPVTGTSESTTKLSTELYSSTTSTIISTMVPSTTSITKSTTLSHETNDHTSPAESDDREEQTTDVSPSSIAANSPCKSTRITFIVVPILYFLAIAAGFYWERRLNRDAPNRVPNEDPDL